MINEIFDNTEFQILNLLNSVKKYIFHGKRTDTGQWVEGHYFTKVYSEGTIEEYWAHIIKDISSGIDYEVHANTVSIYLGFDDKDGNKIFLHDVVMFNSNNNHAAVIFYDANCLSLRMCDDIWHRNQDIMELKCSKIIRLGSIHDLDNKQLESFKLSEKKFIELFNRKREILC